jgi:uracil-DNA glycosylase
VVSLPADAGRCPSCGETQLADAKKVWANIRVLHDMSMGALGVAPRRVLLVGEVNPYGADPRMALYHLPRGASGDRLREILGLDDATYGLHLSMVNLCAGRWSTRAARDLAGRLLAARPEQVFVLLGARVRDALDGPSFLEHELRWVDGGARSKTLLSLPHPSGRNLLWNDPAARGRAREALRQLAPEISWGRADADSRGEARDGR